MNSVDVILATPDAVLIVEESPVTPPISKLYLGVWQYKYTKVSDLLRLFYFEDSKLDFFCGIRT